MDAWEEEVTKLLKRATAGDNDARSKLMDVVYSELRAAASRHMSRERTDHTLQPTALVNEAYLRLFAEDREIHSRVHFFALASQVMRSLLVDHARSRGAIKRGNGAELIPLDDNHAFAFKDPSEILALHEALERLESVNSRAARVVEMRFFGALREAEVAELLQTHVRTIRRDWTFAKAFLRHEIARSN